METTSKIYAAMGQVMAAVKAVEKGRKNQQQGFMFRGIDDMMNTLHGMFAEAGIIILPHELEHIQDMFTTAKGGTMLHSRIHFQFDFVSTADGSQVSADGWGEAMDTVDKGYNKCKSIALKYALMDIFLIPTEDIADPDRETPDAIQAPKQPAPTPASDDVFLMRDDVRRAQTRADLAAAWRNWGGVYPAETKAAITARRKELGIER